MKLLLILTLFVAFSCSSDPKIVIIKQWHLAPGKDTSNIKAGKALAQYENQVAIYKYLEKKIENNPVIIAEGCEGEIDHGANFNGWTIETLRKHTTSSEFESIMAPVFMKLKAKYPNSNIVCGDNLKDIELNNLAFSDLRGYAGYYERLVQNKKDPEIFDKYKQSLNELAGRKVSNPIEYTRTESLKALKKSKELIESRNHSFYEVAKKYKGQEVYIVIGGIHAQHLGELFKKDEISYETFTPKGYAEIDQQLYEALEKSLMKKDEGRTVYWMEVPRGFDPNSIPIDNLLEVNEVSSPSEWEELKALLEHANLNPQILLSDFDKDGIRDFTVSTSGAMIIISAEDEDWDNDGVLNLVDSSWSSFNYPVKIIDEGDISNRFNVQGVSANQLIKDLGKSGISLLAHDDLKHDLLILKVFGDILGYLKDGEANVKFLRTSKPLFKYGKEVYFSYRPSSRTIDIYVEDLIAKFKEMHQKHYSNKSQAELVKGYLLPLLYHSLSHEIVHSMQLPVEEMAQEGGWTFTREPLQSRYLNQKRLKRKMIHHTLKEQKFKNKTGREWLQEFRKEESDFLIKKGIPSLYSLEKPSEWLAEAISMCFMRKAFPHSKNKQGSRGFEKLLGINPSSVGQKFCKEYFSAKD
ncbi:MAG: hypothetical protein CME64_02750 [Halobacteriovoraceae bacterium]|nr:hypothetical protein [Halobacteriovoraceae bacterium]|tara:strand:- start:50894 stop:52804 length:1911 start_codon:yes stop_codon:yes gene_type:complete